MQYIIRPSKSNFLAQLEFTFIKCSTELCAEIKKTKKNAVQAAGADHSQCNSTNRQNHTRP